ncbi:hypothetical protein PBRA_004168 [Plasmodiophora brassicae]|uniref:Uncharacterized protein n=1 Tax=Plasmodiophora brassicae TaxID=37360 RepID=A0A0G4IK13_PLABS|nr:hypothetical protein PBRA_004168 [Plasmodiophora brassicae]
MSRARPPDGRLSRDYSTGPRSVWSSVGCTSSVSTWTLGHDSHCLCARVDSLAMTHRRRPWTFRAVSAMSTSAVATMPIVNAYRRSCRADRFGIGAHRNALTAASTAEHGWQKVDQERRRRRSPYSPRRRCRVEHTTVQWIGKVVALVERQPGRQLRQGIWDPARRHGRANLAPFRLRFDVAPVGVHHKCQQRRDISDVRHHDWRPMADCHDEFLTRMGVDPALIAGRKRIHPSSVVVTGTKRT